MVRHVVEAAVELGIELRGNVLHVAIEGDTTPEETRAAAERLRSTIMGHEGELVSLIDLMLLGSSDKASRKILVEAMKAYQHKIRRAAVFSPFLTSRIQAKIVSTLAERLNFGIFKTKEEALKWLEEGGAVVTAPGASADIAARPVRAGRVSK